MGAQECHGVGRGVDGRRTARSVGERSDPALERLVAIGYGLTYDAVVRGFPPYEALLAEVAGLVSRAATPGPPAATRVLDVSCGTGTLAERLARAGWTVVGLDSVAHLVDVGRRRHCDSGLSLSFHHADAAQDPIPEAEPTTSS